MQTPLSLLQIKCGVAGDGVFGPNTYKAIMTYYKLSNNIAAHFMGQCSHETGNFTAFAENLNYSANGLMKTFKKYFPTLESTVGYANNEQKIANKVYGNRMQNGTESSGDGFKFKGRGAIQLTGRLNYTLFATSINKPEVLINTNLVANELAFEAALWFFKTNGLFKIADNGTDLDTIINITKKVNGGTHGLDDRVAKTQKYAAYIK